MLISINMAKRYLLLLHVVALLLPCFLITDAEAASSSNMSKANCTDRCGTVTIPYPYGMGRPECFLNEWYEIECRNETHPFLKKINLEVLGVDFSFTVNDRNEGFCQCRKSYSYITVNFPMMFSNPNCTSDTGVTSPQPPSLEGSPFIFSTDWNIFIAVGCGVKATLNSSSNNGFVGCQAECRGGNFTVNSTCSGLDSCCQTSIPDYLQTLNLDIIDLDGTDIKDQQCNNNNYATLVNGTWLGYPSRDLEALKMEGYVPVVLDSRIPNEYIDGVYTLAYCDETSHRLIRDDFLQCACGSGYQGNPYFPGGCQDIDECEDQAGLCPVGRTCENTLGAHLCVEPVGPSRKLKFVMIGVGSSVGALLLVLIGWWLYKIIKKRKEAKLKQRHFKRNGGLLLQQHLSLSEGNVQGGKLFNQKELEMATRNFSQTRVEGKGGQGTVYKGMLADGRIVAVKKALTISEARVEQFINEVTILSQINHRNIVKLLGCCLETEIPLLVYEFIPNGTLYDYLHESNKDVPVSWDVRLQLAIEIAGALFYLHSAASIPIYHRDIKSTNILLDEKFRAKVADFGTSRSISLDETHVTTEVQGTFGYLDPEYFYTNQFTDKSDVYSFGVVLAELLTGRKPVSILSSEEARSLSAYFILAMENGKLFEILDSEIVKQGVEEEILIVANLAKRCLNINGRRRPTMKEVAIELEGVKKLRHLTNVQESEDNCMSIQYQDISRSTSAKLEINTNVRAKSDVDPLLFG